MEEAPNYEIAVWNVQGSLQVRESGQQWVKQIVLDMDHCPLKPSLDVFSQGTHKQRVKEEVTDSVSQAKRLNTPDILHTPPM